MKEGTSTLIGRIVIKGKIKAVTGLRIGGATGGLNIGNVDLPVIRDSLSGRPYIPGSSLKGKMRSLGERLTGAPQNRNLNSTNQVYIHVAEDRDQYDKYWVNPIFGSMPASGEKAWVMPAPNRLIVRDVALDENSAKHLAAAKTDLPFTEVKWEAAIDRVTSAAAPRQIERVPAGAVFGPMELVFNLYLPDDLGKLFPHILTCLALVEDDYLGGHGSRGSGKVIFEELSITYKHGAEYRGQNSASYANLADLKTEGITWLSKQAKG